MCPSSIAVVTVNEPFEQRGQRSPSRILRMLIGSPVGEDDVSIVVVGMSSDAKKCAVFWLWSVGEVLRFRLGKKESR